jgi:hypothetical protein
MNIMITLIQEKVQQIKIQEIKHYNLEHFTIMNNHLIVKKNNKVQIFIRLIITGHQK